MTPRIRTSVTQTAGPVTNLHDSRKGNLSLRYRRPLITYGKKDSRPLPLKATQFKHGRNPYNISADANFAEDERLESNESGVRAEAGIMLEAAADDDSESGLSDEPERVTLQRFQQLAKRSSTDAAADRSLPLPNTNAAKKTSAKRRNTPNAKPADLKDGPSPSKRVKRNPKGAPNNFTGDQRRRRLPVDELFLVASPVDNTNFGTPKSSLSGIHVQDPIHDKTSSPVNRGVSPCHSEDDQAGERSSKKHALSAFKKRRQPDRLRCKSVSDLQKRRAGQSLTPFEPSNPGYGDGFDSGELFVSPLARKTVRTRRFKQDPFVQSFGALQLQAGPLPDVTFEPTSLPLKTEHNVVVSRSGRKKETSESLARHVTFNDTAREEAIIAQLSTISAPPVPRPLSDDSDDEEDSQPDDQCEDQRTEVDEDQIAEGSQALQRDDIHAADPQVQDDLKRTPAEKVARIPVDAHESSLLLKQERLGNKGVSLDFRRHGPGQLPCRRIRQDAMEINDRIVDVPAPDSLFEIRSQPGLSEQQFQEQPPVPTPAKRHPSRSQHKRPRSILKNASQAVSDSTTQATHTAANMRRNGTIELSESRYFMDATDVFRQVDPSKHIIVPRRRSSYFNEVEMLDGGAAVHKRSSSPELGAGATDYTCTSDSDDLRAVEAERTSQSCPVDPRDLRTLTRSVSREHGTLSQSVRRRPSLPFQSPSKVR